MIRFGWRFRRNMWVTMPWWIALPCFLAYSAVILVACLVVVCALPFLWAGRVLSERADKRRT